MLSESNPPPVLESDDILIDTMMISQILQVKWQYELIDQHFRWKHNLEISTYNVQKIKGRLDKHNSKLILLNIIEDETIDMKLRTYGITYSENDIEDALSAIGDCHKVFVNDSPKLIDQALDLHKNQDYDCPKGKLSREDCFLLIMHVTQPQRLLTRPASLLTEEECLQIASNVEGRQTKGIEDVGVTYSQKKEWEKLEQEKLYKEKKLEREKLYKEKKPKREKLYKEKAEKKKLTKKSNFCPGCEISFSKGKECPNCGTPLRNIKKRKN